MGGLQSHSPNHHGVAILAKNGRAQQDNLALAGPSAQHMPVTAIFNAKDGDESEPKAMWAGQSVRHYDCEMVLAADPMGHSNFWFAVTPIQDPEEVTAAMSSSGAMFPSRRCTLT